MLSIAYFLAKFRFDTAENEPAKNLKNLLILLTLTPLTSGCLVQPLLEGQPPRVGLADAGPVVVVVARLKQD